MNRRQQLLQTWLASASPDVVEWLQANMTLSKQVAPMKPGKFSITGRPFMREILNCWHPDSGVNDCVVNAGTQMLKSLSWQLGLCYRVCNEMLPTMILVPTEKHARETVSKSRLHPLIKGNPAVAAKMSADPDKFTMLDMEMEGGNIWVVGSNSSTNLSGKTTPIVVQDECAKIEHHEVEGVEEAHPMELADERAKDALALAFRYKSSSPNVETHPFWRYYELGTQTHIYVKCPNCPDNWFSFEFERDEKSNYKSLYWTPDARGKDGDWNEMMVRETARYVCPKCGYHIQSHEKPAMIEGYETKHHNPHAALKNRSFRMPSILSPNVTFGDVAWEFLRKNQKGDLFADPLQNLMNSWWALPYNRAEVEVKEDAVKALRRDGFRSRTIPFPPEYLLMTADPGETSGTHWMVIAMMENEEMFIVDWDVCLAVEDLPNVAKRLQYQVAGTTKMISPTRGLVDSRFGTERVLDMCARSRGFWHPTRGSDASYGTWSEAPSRTHPGVTTYIFIDKTLKDEFYEKRVEQKAAPRVYLPEDVAPELIEQLSGQKRINGRWKRLPRDHWGDCAKQGVLSQWIVRSFRSATAGASAPESDNKRTP